MVFIVVLVRFVDELSGRKGSLQ